MGWWTWSPCEHSRWRSRPGREIHQANRAFCAAVSWSQQRRRHSHAWEPVCVLLQCHWICSPRRIYYWYVTKPPPLSPFPPWTCWNHVSHKPSWPWETEQREYFMSELAFYCKMCIVERKIRKSLGSRIPTLEEFWEYRLGTAATLLTYAAAE